MYKYEVQLHICQGINLKNPSASTGSSIIKLYISVKTVKIGLKISNMRFGEELPYQRTFFSDKAFQQFVLNTYRMCLWYSKNDYLQIKEVKDRKSQEPQ